MRSPVLITEAAQAGRTVKPVGSDHSFTEISATDGVQLHLDQLTGITDVDYDSGLITVLGGTSLAELNMSLAAHCLALENLGDTDRQTITGAISTGTHGTGAKFGGLATQVRGLTMITADGTQLHCSAVEHSRALRCRQSRSRSTWSDQRGHPAMRTIISAACRRRPGPAG
jgi:FAD/FMN-containing dehydrogenase